MAEVLRVSSEQLRMQVDAMMAWKKVMGIDIKEELSMPPIPKGLTPEVASNLEKRGFAVVGIPKLDMPGAGEVAKLSGYELADMVGERYPVLMDTMTDRRLQHKYWETVKDNMSPPPDVAGRWVAVRTHRGLNVDEIEEYYAGNSTNPEVEEIIQRYFGVPFTRYLNPTGTSSYAQNDRTRYAKVLHNAETEEVFDSGFEGMVTTTVPRLFEHLIMVKSGIYRPGSSYEFTSSPIYFMWDGERKNDHRYWISRQGEAGPMLNAEMGRFGNFRETDENPGQPILGLRPMVVLHTRAA